MAVEVFSILGRSLSDEATNSGTDSDYRGENTASVSVEEGTQSSCVVVQEMKR
jgi:hypothetical protein